MTDGPFKNADLSGRWKRYGNSLTNDSMSSQDRTERVHSAILRDLCTKETRELVVALDTYVKRLQKDLFPRVAVDEIFNNHARTPQSDTLQKFFSANLARPMAIESAWQLAFDSFVRHEAYGTKNRMLEECMNARDRGDLRGAKYSKAIRRHDEAFAALDLSKIRDHALSGKSASRIVVQKKTGIEDGPEW